MALKIDLDDYISLSEECVKPLIEAAQGKGFKLNGTDASALTRVQTSAPVVEVPQVERPNLIKTKKSVSDPTAQIAGVTLSDCLACSGCVTSAETVLLQEQSGEEFRKRSAEAGLTVVSISGEARTSVAMHCGISPLLAFQRLATGLQRLGVDYVLECSAAEALALLEGKSEFVRRFKASSEKQGNDSVKPQLPLLTSHCPGWTCYAEKVVDPAVIPHLSPLRPPQQVQGRLVKTCLLEAHNRRRLHRWWRARSPLFAAESGWWLRSVLPSGDEASASLKPLEPQDVYHAVVQPCFDRKIEAARPSFTVSTGDGIREVDTVLTTAELLELVHSSAPDPSVSSEQALEATDPCPLTGGVLTDLMLGDLQRGRPHGRPLLVSVPGNAGSGGFIEHVFREGARELFGRDDIVTPLELEEKKNEDMREIVLREKGTDQVLLRFIAAYGFRNIQNVIKRITKKGSNPTKECGHFVEIMACPGGCLNGGGQIPAPSREGGRKGQTADRKSHLSQLEQTRQSGDGTVFVPPLEHPLVAPLYRYMVAHSSKDSAPTECSLDRLVGADSVRSFLSADWRSLKVDSDGNSVVGTSALKW